MASIKFIRKIRRFISLILLKPIQIEGIINEVTRKILGFICYFYINHSIGTIVSIKP